MQPWASVSSFTVREILVSRRVNDEEGVRALINKDGRALLPRRDLERPHPHFLRWHRDHCFKQ
jgi:putative restriction endonuclease